MRTTYPRTYEGVNLETFQITLYALDDQGQNMTLKTLGVPPNDVTDIYINGTLMGTYDQGNIDPQ